MPEDEEREPFPGLPGLSQAEQQRQAWERERRARERAADAEDRRSWGRMLRMALSVALLVTGCNPIWIDQDDNSVSLWQLIGAITDGLGVLVGGGVLLALVVLLAAVLTPTGRLGRNRQVFTVAVLFCLSLGLVVLAAQGADQQFEGMQANYLTCLLLAAATGVAWIPRDTVDGG